MKPDIATIPYNTFVRLLCKPGEAILASSSAEDAHLNHMCIGLWELGELASCLSGFHGVNCPKVLEGLLNNLTEEGGDHEFFLTGIENCFLINGVNPFESTTEPTGMLPWVLSTKNTKFSSPLSYISALAVIYGDLADLIKNQTIYRKGRAESIEVCRLVYQARVILGRIYESFGLTRDAVIAYNKVKLSKRYASLTYTDANAITRADKA